jgi:hypothetical protein
VREKDSKSKCVREKGSIRVRERGRRSNTVSKIVSERGRERGGGGRGKERGEVGDDCLRRYSTKHIRVHSFEKRLSLPLPSLKK